MRRYSIAALIAAVCVLVPLGVASAVTVNASRTALAVPKVVALTFDDGPSVYTTEIVKTLKRKRATATFFQVGTMVKAHPDITRFVVRTGMVVANHSMNHQHYIDWQQNWVQEDLAEAQSAIHATTGRWPTWYKPPYMEWNPAYDTVLPSLALGLCWPDCAPDDWDGWTAQRIVDAVVNDVRPGTVIGLHDGGPTGTEDRGATARAVGPIVDRLRARGYRFVTLDEIPNATVGRP